MSSARDEKLLPCATAVHWFTCEVEGSLDRLHRLLSRNIQDDGTRTGLTSEQSTADIDVVRKGSLELSIRLSILARLPDALGIGGTFAHVVQNFWKAAKGQLRKTADSLRKVTAPRSFADQLALLDRLIRNHRHLKHYALSVMNGSEPEANVRAFIQSFAGDSSPEKLPERIRIDSKHDYKLTREHIAKLAGRSIDSIRRYAKKHGASKLPRPIRQARGIKLEYRASEIAPWLQENFGKSIDHLPEGATPIDPVET